MEELITVQCVETLEPPQVQVTIAGQIPFQVSMGAYQFLVQNFGFPDNPCAGVGE